MPGKTLYVSDMDGTLLSPDSVVTPRTAELLNNAISQGALFTVATARTPATVSRLMRDVKMNIPAVVMTGSALWSPDDNRYSDLVYMDADMAHSLVDIYCSTDLPAFVYTLKDNIIHIYHLGEISDLEQRFIDERIDNPYKRFHLEDLTSVGLPEKLDNVLLFYSMQPDCKVVEAYEKIRCKDVIANYYHDIFGAETAILEVFSPRATKANAVRTLAASIGADRIVAFGDNVNDLTVMQTADLAVAVGNAVAEVKEVADIVIGDNAQDSVAEFIINDLSSAKRNNL